VVLLEGQLHILSCQAFTTREEFVYRDQKEMILVSGNRAAQRMNDRILSGELASLRQKSAVSSGHHRNSRSASRGTSPETSPQWIVVHASSSDPRNPGPRISHIGVLAVNAGAAGTVLIRKHGHHNVTQAVQCSLRHAVDVILNSVQFYQRGKIIVRPGPGG
jgi:hypothetical protein